MTRAPGAIVADRRSDWSWASILKAADRAGGGWRLERWGFAFKNYIVGFENYITGNGHVKSKETIWHLNGYIHWKT